MTSSEYDILDKVLGVKGEHNPNSPMYDQQHVTWQMVGFTLTIVDSDDDEFIQFYIDKEGTEIILQCLTFYNVLHLAHILSTGDIIIQ